ncbi:uncharacterized protein LOC113227426 [Hyposmocoma kahamanoa]|uniref:uncharacterized protein LOC113227426 n=1 Tax=Hyposmocoma kahamanoa TaxID=1477025 RepID=UPI000E6D6D01|nr:uncharacterized protein LOC113227426 [Hyposmocoma kahamanoa]
MYGVPAQRFNGFNDVDEFLNQFETISILNNWSDVQKKYVFALYLEGPALQWYKTYSSSYVSYDVIAQRLREEFPSQIDYAREFYYRRQGHSESLISYFYSLNELAMKANIQDVQFIKHFLKSLIPNFKWMLASNLYLSKEELRKTIIQVDDVFNHSYNVRQDIELPVNCNMEHSCCWQTQDVSAPIIRPESKQSEYLVPRAPIVHQDTPSQGYSRAHSSGSSPGSPQRDCQKSATEHVENLSTFDRSSVDRAPFISVFINDVCCEALVDTNASNSVISRYFAERLQLRIDDSPSFPLRIVGATPINVRSSTKVSLMINGKGGEDTPSNR